MTSPRRSTRPASSRSDAELALLATKLQLLLAQRTPARWWPTGIGSAGIRGRAHGRLRAPPSRARCVRAAGSFPGHLLCWPLGRCCQNCYIAGHAGPGGEGRSAKRVPEELELGAVPANDPAYGRMRCPIVNPIHGSGDRRARRTPSWPRGTSPSRSIRRSASLRRRRSIRTSSRAETIMGDGHDPATCSTCIEINRIDPLEASGRRRVPGLGSLRRSGDGEELRAQRPRLRSMRSSRSRWRRSGGDHDLDPVRADPAARPGARAAGGLPARRSAIHGLRAGGPAVPARRAARRSSGAARSHDRTSSGKGS